MQFVETLNWGKIIFIMGSFEMQKLGNQQLKKLLEELESLWSKIFKKNIHGDMRDGEYSDFIIIT